MHRAAPAVRGPCLLAEELGHHRIRVEPFGERVAVLAVGAVDIILGPQRRNGADDRRLLADVEVAEAADLGRLVHLGGLLFEASDQQHLTVELEQGLLIRKPGLRTALGGSLFDFHEGPWVGRWQVGCKTPLL